MQCASDLSDTRSRENRALLRAEPPETIRRHRNLRRSMTTLTKTAQHAEPRTALIWQTRVDALTCGACSEDDFMDDIENLLDVDPDSARSIIAFLDQRYQRGLFPEELYRSIESRITRRELEMIDSGITINLDSVLAPRPVAPPLQPVAPPLQPVTPPDSRDSLTVPGKGLEAAVFAPAAATAPWAQAALQAAASPALAAAASASSIVLQPDTALAGALASLALPQAAQSSMLAYLAKNCGWQPS